MSAFTPTEPQVSAPRQRSLQSWSSWSRAFILTVLFTTAAVYATAKFSALTSPEVWIHLRTGLWILQTHSIPRTGLFSQSSTLPWIDASWGFDLIAAVLFKLFGLRTILIWLIGLRTGLAISTFVLARVAGARFWSAVILSAWAQYVTWAFQPTPAALSILLFGFELAILVSCRQTAKTRVLYWLPLLFLFWANLHIQFVAGLLLLLLFVFSAAIESLLANRLSRLSSEIQPLNVKRVGAVAGFSFLMTLLNPYHVHIFPLFMSLYTPVGFEHFAELSSMNFRQPQQYGLMLLIMIGFLALGRSRQSFDLFLFTSLLAGTLVAFRIERDGWMAVLPAVAAISSRFRIGEITETLADRAERSANLRWSAVLTAAVLLVSAVLLPRDLVLQNRIARDFPVKACDYIAANRLPQPLFNDYEWGSFLTWYLPGYPVDVDGRVELYGNDSLSAYFDTIGGQKLLESDPVVEHQNTLLLERKSAMAKALTDFPALRAEYRLVYQDDIASVFVRQGSHP